MPYQPQVCAYGHDGIDDPVALMRYLLHADTQILAAGDVDLMDIDDREGHHTQQGARVRRLEFMVEQEKTLLAEVFGDKYEVKVR